MILIAELITTTTKEVRVKVPDNLEVVTNNGKKYIVKPGSGIHGPKVLLTPTIALRDGLLELVEESG
jgi:ribosomal protein S4E